MTSPTDFHGFFGSKVPNLFNYSDKQADNQFGRTVSYGSGNDPSVSEISNQFPGNNRNHSDPDLMGSSRDRVPPIISNRSNLLKMSCNGSAGDRPRLSPYDRPLHGSPQNRPLSPSFMMQQTGRAFSNIPKCERSDSLNSGGGSIYYNPYIAQTSSVMYQMPSSRFKEGGSCPTVSQMAADECSRTGNKNSGILKSFNPGNSLVSERNLSEIAPTGCNVNPMTCTFDQISSDSPCRHGLTSNSKQMTIIFDGQLHVFDDVNPKKADVIMALAGSDGGFWSTTLPKSSVRELTNGGCLPARETKKSLPGDLPQKYNSKLLGGGNFNYPLGSPNSNKGGMVKQEASRDSWQQRESIGIPRSGNC